MWVSPWDIYFWGMDNRLFFHKKPKVSQREKKSPRTYLASDDREGIWAHSWLLHKDKSRWFKDILAGWKKDSFWKNCIKTRPETHTQILQAATFMSTRVFWHPPAWPPHSWCRSYMALQHTGWEIRIKGGVASALTWKVLQPSSAPLLTQSPTVPPPCEVLGSRGQGAEGPLTPHLLLLLPLREQTGAVSPD